MRLSDAQRRALRTTAQALVAGVLAALYDLLSRSTDIPDQTTLLRTVVVATLTGLVSLSHNWLEDNSTVPAIGKAPASEGVNPVPDPDPAQRPAGGPLNPHG